MSTSYASGKRSVGICDRCGRKYPLLQLKKQVVNMVATDLLVCSACLDVDHPQLQLGKEPVYDPQALRNPRPDNRSDVTTVPQLTSYTGIGAPVFTEE